jgi:hypothetical protein
MEAIRQLVLRILTGSKKSGIVTTLPPKNVLDFQTMILAEKFMQNGVDPRMFKNADQAENMLKQIDEADKARMSSGITETQSAKVFNIEGQQLDPNKPIMGGTQTGKELSKDRSERLASTNVERIKQKIADKKIDDEQPPPGSRGGKDDIAASVQSREETLKNMIQAENKKNIAAMKNRKMLDDAIEDASPGFANDIKYDAEIVAENLAERMGLVYDDLPTKQRLDLYDQAYTGLSKQRFKNKPKPDDDPEDFAKGGIARIGLKSGSLKKFLERRNFLKTIVGNSPEAENARILQKILDEQKEFKKFLDKNPPVKFPGPGDKEYDDYILRLNQIMAKDRLKSATGGRIGLKEGLGSFSTNDPKEAAKEVIQRLIRIDDAKIPLDEKLSIALQGVDGAELQGVMEILGGELSFGVGKKGSNKGIGFNFSKQFNKGGRVGYKVGGFDKARRAFLKMLGLGAGATAAAKSGILRFSDSMAPKVIEKVPINSSTVSTPPPYFFELAEKIKKLGKPDKVTYQERVEVTRYTGKNGDEYELVEDLNTGDMQITKDKTGVGSYGDKSFDTIEDRTVLEYKKGRGDETTKGTPADEYEEYKVEFDSDGTPADATDMDAIVQKEIIEEAKGDAPSIKKAGGGIARMLGE